MNAAIKEAFLLMPRYGYIREAEAGASDSPAEKVKMGSDVVYIEEPPTTPAGRPRLNKLMAEIGEGDYLVTASFSEIAGSSHLLMNIVSVLNAKGADLISLREGVDTSTGEGKAVIRAMMALKELDEASMAEWTRNRVDYIKRNASPKHQIGRKK